MNIVSVWLLVSGQLGNETQPLPTQGAMTSPQILALLFLLLTNNVYLLFYIYFDP